MGEIAFIRSDGNTFQDLNLCFCGHEKCESLHKWGPCVRPGYIIHYILSGKGIYQVGDKTWELKEKDGFLIEPEVSTFYQADAKDPWEYMWVSFDGKLSSQVLANLGLGGENLTFHCEKKAEIKQVISNMLKNGVYSLSNNFALASQLYLFFAILLRDMEVQASLSPSKGNGYVRIAQEYIRNNYARPDIKVADIAAYTNVNRSYLYTLFQKELGMSPQEYLTAFRLTRAEELLKNTDYSIETISLSSGYNDPVVFSRAFKRFRGMTPMKSRALNKQEELEKLQKRQGRMEAEEGFDPEA